MGREYFLGLDIGTSSLGWAVTDVNYNILRAKGKNLIGSRLFEEGKTASERRSFRSSRRMNARKKERIKLLQELFAEEINKIDPTFFQRLKESKYYLEDKTEKDCPFALFNDKEFTDKEYYKLYPTIYHLRKDLIESSEKKDIRLIYLAIHNIIKNRGHFLLGDKEIESVKNFHDAKESLIEAFYEIGIELHILNEEMFENTLKDNKMTKKDKLNSLFKNIKISYENKIELKEKENMTKELFKLLNGQNTNLKKGFNNESLVLETNNKAINLTFNTDNYEQELEEIENLLSENELFFLEKIKKTYDWSILANILNGNSCLSNAKVSIYDKHKKDLADLKYIIKTYIPEEYKNMFSSIPSNKNDANYVKYTGHYIENKKKVYCGNKVNQEEFCKYITKKLSKIKEEDPIKERILEECKSEKLTFMPKQIDRKNGVLPYQLHLEELRKILSNAEKHYDFLNKNDSKGYSTKYKIEKLLTFRIPYYVGPLNDKDKDKGFCWVEKKNNEKIYPWNFDEIVDKDKSAENFIMRMTNKCTYLIGEDVLPNQSILYSKFRVLNELNNLKINNEKPDVKIKKKIYEELFLTGKTITNKKIKEFYKREYGLDVEISGIDGDFKNKMDSYAKLKNILGDLDNNIKNIEIAENVILWSTVLGSEKKMLRKKIKSSYKNLTDKQIEKLVSINFNGWGKLSKKFLTEIKTDIEGQTDLNIIQAMYETNYNLMQLLSNQFEYTNIINNFNKNLSKDIDSNNLDYETLVEDLYVSPSVKRSIWQTVKVVKEIQEVMGCEPKRIFIEMPRGDKEKKRVSSRKKNLEECYKNCKQEEHAYLKEFIDDGMIEKLSNIEESRLRSKKLYLYYTQMGRDMYTGERIELSELFTTKYDIDHIYPRSKTKDDSINKNLVLVRKDVNSRKSDEYPLSNTIQKKQNSFWDLLLEKKLIDEKKHERLTRKIELTSNELATFIERQLVFTGQSTKAVANILEKIMEESEIVYTKAENTSDFRNEVIDFVKVRELNDLHHAHDAYLAIVVGNVYYVKFTKNVLRFINSGGKYNLYRMYENDVKTKNETAWIKGENGTKKTVKKMLSKGGILFTRYSYSVKGGLFDQNIINKEKSGSGQGYLPIKSNKNENLSVEKYGGYNKVTGSFFAYVESEDKKGNKIRTLENIPLYKVLNSKNELKDIEEYILENSGLKNPNLLIPKIKINSLFEINGYPMHISGRTGDRIIMKSAVQLKIDYEKAKYLKQVIKYASTEKEDKNMEETLKLTGKDNIDIYEYLYEKIINSIYSKRPAIINTIKCLETGKSKFEKLSIYEQCIQIKKIIRIFNTTSEGIDLETIGGSKQTSVLRINKKLSDNDKVFLINQSPTGIFENRINLLQDVENFKR
ncbi:type II CRISPR RNA-guided endonuclease Cas9 [Peptacetobacter sp.]|uniref:type II CRISPR RNA-guided endonuclease Cas9 n=1 Tax=Peptacetobacter sp. TaxID=2991975 RepID=UPI00261BBD5B|nr:type II CRISPR RNA-guided endonuclease Cas9 [Peptacetobacter sp.]